MACQTRRRMVITAVEALPTTGTERRNVKNIIEKRKDTAVATVENIGRSTRIENTTRIGGGIDHIHTLHIHQPHHHDVLDPDLGQQNVTGIRRNHIKVIIIAVGRENTVEAAAVNEVGQKTLPMSRRLEQLWNVFCKTKCIETHDITQVLLIIPNIPYI